MADINQVITLGIGTPSDIEHFVLVGLNANPVTGGQIFKLAGGGGGLAGLHRGLVAAPVQEPVRI